MKPFVVVIVGALLGPWVQSCRVSCIATSGEVPIVQAADTQERLCEFTVRMFEDDELIATIQHTPVDGRCGFMTLPGPDIAGDGVYVFEVSAPGYKTARETITLKYDEDCEEYVLVQRGTQPMTVIETVIIALEPEGP